MFTGVLCLGSVAAVKVIPNIVLFDHYRQNTSTLTLEPYQFVSNVFKSAVTGTGQINKQSNRGQINKQSYEEVHK